MTEFIISGMPRNSDVFMMKFNALIEEIREKAQPEFSFIAVAKPDIELNSDTELQRIADTIMMIFALALRSELKSDFNFTRTPHGLASDVFNIVRVTT